MIATILPLWLGLAAAFMQMARKVGTAGEAAETIGWGTSLRWSATMLSMLGVLVVVLWTIIWGSTWLLALRSRRRSDKRYDEIVRGGDILRSDSWALTDGAEPEEQPTDPG